MINETIKRIFFKGDDGLCEDRIYLDNDIIFQTESGFYTLNLSGFEILKHVNLSGYEAWKNDKVTGQRMLEIYTNEHDLYIRLSDKWLLHLSVGGALSVSVLGDVELNIEKEDESLRNWFESNEPREDNLQKLSKENSYWRLSS